MAAIKFFKEDLRFNFLYQTRARRWLKSCASAEGYVIKDLNFIFTSDESLVKMNIQYLNHRTLTDIITFDNSETHGLIEGDVFISVPRVRENALKFAQSFEQELFRVLIHGMLHLMGYQDKTERSKKVMRQKEEAYLSLLRFRRST